MRPDARLVDASRSRAHGSGPAAVGGVQSCGKLRHKLGERVGHDAHLTIHWFFSIRLNADRYAHPAGNALNRGRRVRRRGHAYDLRVCVYREQRLLRPSVRTVSHWRPDNPATAAATPAARRALQRHSPGVARERDETRYEVQWTLQPPTAINHGWKRSRCSRQTRHSTCSVRERDKRSTTFACAPAMASARRTATRRWEARGSDETYGNMNSNGVDTGDRAGTPRAAVTLPARIS
jgi:hypothetical protein